MGAVEGQPKVETFHSGQKAIKARSIRQVPTERLENRLEALRRILSPEGARRLESRYHFRMRVVEVTHVEDELAARSVDFTPVTRR